MRHRYWGTWMSWNPFTCSNETAVIVRREFGWSRATERSLRSAERRGSWDQEQWWFRDFYTHGCADTGHPSFDVLLAETRISYWNYDHLVPLWDESPDNAAIKQQTVAWEAQREPHVGHAWNDPRFFVPRLGIFSQHVWHFGIVMEAA